MFTLWSSHIVRNCSSLRCKKSIHWHCDFIEVLLEADGVDNGQMVMDFWLTKGTIKDLIMSFEKSYSIWDKESEHFKENIKYFTDLWIEMPASPSAEIYSLMILFLIDKIIKNTEFKNGEQNVRVTSVKFHETRTGYAESFMSDLENPKMPKFSLDNITFSDKIKARWSDPQMIEKIKRNEKFINPIVDQQV